MKRLLPILCYLLSVTCPLSATESRYYLVRGGQLPQDVTSVDLRPDHGQTSWALRNIYASSTARYALFEKRADSWWQVSVETPASRSVDLSELPSEAWVCMRLRRTVDYTLTLCMAGQTTDEGYRITTSQVPANGQWYTLRVPFTKPADHISGSLMRLHSDLGFTGNEVGIDYCYITTDPTTLDEGAVLPEERYYLVSNKHTPRDVAYTLHDLTSELTYRNAGWQQWSYIPFPYLSQETAQPAVLQLCGDVSLGHVGEDWALIAQVRTDMLGALVATLYLPNGRLYRDTISALDLTRDNTTWNRLYLPLDEAAVRGTCTSSTDVRFSLTSVGALSAGEFALGSLMLTNNHGASDPDPFVPGDPANGQQIWLVGSSLPENTSVTDYRLFSTDYLTASYGNNTQRKTTDSWLTLLPTNGWYSADIAVAGGKTVDLTPVRADWKVYTRIRTTSTYRPINLIFYQPGNQQLYRYQLTATDLPVSGNGQWYEFTIPMSTILGAQTSLFSYSGGQRVLSFHSDNGGTSGVEVSMEYLYFAREGESTPDPVPGLTPLTEPAFTPDIAEGMESAECIVHSAKFLRDGQLLIQAGGKTYNAQGQTVK